MSRAVTILLGFAVAVIIPACAPAQASQASTPGAPAQGGTKPPATERLGENLFRLGTIRVDTARGEISVPGKINGNVTTLEFIANARDGARAYETAITLDTDAITFNAALLMIGLDPARTRNAPTRHFDPAIPEGDTVEIWIDCPGGECQRMPAEQLIYDKDAKQAMSGGTWVYTGSGFLPDGRYLPQVDGTLVSFSHDPAAIIEHRAGIGLNRYGSIVLPPRITLTAGLGVSVIVRVIR